MSREEEDRVVNIIIRGKKKKERVLEGRDRLSGEGEDARMRC